MSEVNAKRLNKFISESGFCSRREADRLVEQGRVTINGVQAEMGTKVTNSDDVRVDGTPIQQRGKTLYIALNKPTGITCTTERDVAGNIVDFIGHKERIFPIGRLDKASDGLIFLTNDGDIVNKILRAGNNHEKEYVVRVDKPISEHFIRKMASGVEILDTVTLPCKVVKETQYSFRITLTQGLNRQIRRMCEALGYQVFKLRRVRIMNISLDGIPNGRWRYLNEQEVNEILSLCEGSSGTEEASKVDGKGKKIKKATDAKLFDAREQDKQEKQAKFKTFKGNDADKFRHSLNRNSNKSKSKGARPAQQSGDFKNRKPSSATPGSKPSSKPKQQQRNDKSRVGGTLKLKK